MNSIDSASGVAQGQIGVQMATKALKLALQEQENIATLIDSVVRGTQPAQEAGKGEHLDVHG
ncbi:MAG: hypothetical protein ACE5EQ_08345 [Phycisphaerae bacterium]